MRRGYRGDDGVWGLHLGLYLQTQTQTQQDARQDTSALPFYVQSCMLLAYIAHIWFGRIEQNRTARTYPDRRSTIVARRNSSVKRRTSRSEASSSCVHRMHGLTSRFPALIDMIDMSLSGGGYEPWRCDRKHPLSGPCRHALISMSFHAINIYIYIYKRNGNRLPPQIRVHRLPDIAEVDDVVKRPLSRGEVDATAAVPVWVREGYHSSRSVAFG